MKRLCLNQKSTYYKNYGGRGIKICKRWLMFENFLEDMGEKPQGKVLGRIDLDKGYYPKNCEWSTMGIQNDRRSKYLKKMR